MVVARRLILLALFVGLLWLGWQFAHSNGAEIDVDLLIARFPNVSTWLTLLVTFLAGGLLIGGLVGLQLLRANLKTRRYRKTVARLEAEIHQLRNLPLAGADTPGAGVLAGDDLHAAESASGS